MSVMVTGGTGYIGAHTVRLLIERGDSVVIVDDVATGSIARVPGIPLLRLDLASDGAEDLLRDAIAEYDVDAVIHFAARKQVGESMRRPAWYYQQNVGGLASLLLAMERGNVHRLVFSSSAAVYAPSAVALVEDDEANPMNPYGATKLVGEEMIGGCAQAWGLRSASLRYFNVGGAAAADLGDTCALNLIPMTFERLDAGLEPHIFGDDYDTADGTCVRDFVHVTDVAEAHLAVLDGLDSAPANTIFNVGTGTGTSVRQMVDAILAHSGSNLRAEVVPRRAGDPASVIASAGRIRQQTGWSARYGLHDIVASAWAAWRAVHPIVP